MAGLGWKALLELGRQEKASAMDDDDRVDTIMAYLMEKSPKCCYAGSYKSDLQLPSGGPLVRTNRR